MDTKTVTVVLAKVYVIILFFDVLSFLVVFEYGIPVVIDCRFVICASDKCISVIIGFGGVVQSNLTVVSLVVGGGIVVVPVVSIGGGVVVRVVSLV